MKVLMFGWEFPPIISGGLGTASYGIVNGLTHNDVEIMFVMPTTRGQKIEAPCEIIAANEVPLIKKYRSIIRTKEDTTLSELEKTVFLSPYFTTETYNEYFRYVSRVKEIKNVLETYHGILDFTGNYGVNLMDEVSRYQIIGEVLGMGEDFDLIHAHDWLTYLAGVAAKKSSGKPLVVHVHATEFDRSGENVNQMVYDIERYGMENADKIVAVSHFTKNIITERYGIDADKVDVVHNAVDKSKQVHNDLFRKNLDEKIVLFLGRVTMQKGPDYFVEACNIVYKKLKNVRFVMAGSGDMLTRMINRVAELRMTDRFHFTGFLKGIQVERMYALSDLYIMPSVSEPFGISPFEALVYDIPIIISKQSGVAEVLKNAMKIDFWDVEKMASMMIDLLENEELARDVVERSKSDIQNVGWDSAGFKLRQVYENVLSHNSTHQFE